MPRLLFGICGLVAAVALAAAGPARAQPIPGRDLLELPVGTLAEAPVLAGATGDGNWNPALVLLSPAVRARASAAALLVSGDASVTVTSAAAAVRLPAGFTLGVGAVRASIPDVVRTDTDPTGIGEVPYHTTVVSAVAARRQTDRVVTGIAVRYRHGVVDTDGSRVLGADLGVLADRLLGRLDARIAASTYLWRLAPDRGDPPTVAAAADLRVLGPGDSAQVRLGYGASIARRVREEHHLFARARSGPWDVQGLVARAVTFGGGSWRHRVGIGLHHARYIVGVAREVAPDAVAPSYQFTLSSTIP